LNIIFYKVLVIKISIMKNKNYNYSPEDKGFLYKTLDAIENNLLGVIIGSIFLTGVGNWTQEMYSTY